MAHRADHATALGLHHRCRISFQCLAESIVSRQEVPALAAPVHNRRARAFGQRHGVVGIVHCVGGALLVGQGRRASAVVEVNAFLLFCHLGNGQGRARVGATKQHRHALGVHPLTRLRGSNVGLVLVVRRDHLDGLAQHLAAEVVDGHLDGQSAVLAFHVGVQTGHVCDETDLDLFLSVCGRGGQARGAEHEGQHCEFVLHGSVSCGCDETKTNGGLLSDQTPSSSVSTGIFCSSSAAPNCSTMRPCSMT